MAWAQPRAICQALAAQHAMMRSYTQGIHRRTCMEWLRDSILVHFLIQSVPVLPVLAMTLWAVLVTTSFTMLDRMADRGNADAWVTNLMAVLSLDSATNSFISLSLMFIMTMRVNQCYSRWWEGRMLWGAIVNRTRNLASHARLWVCDSELQGGIIRYATAFAHATKHHLRGESGIPDLRDSKLVPEKVCLSASELAEVELLAHMPVHLLSIVRGYVSQAYSRRLISDMQLQCMDGDITSLIDALGGCERILQTPFPLSFVSHIRSFTFLYLFFLPMTLVRTSGWATITICFLVCVALMGVEHTSAEIEQPFGHGFNDLKLDVICTTIHTNLAQISCFRQPGDVSAGNQEVAGSSTDNDQNPFAAIL